MNEVLFIPSSAQNANPLFWIIVWKENIMNVDEYTRTKTWKNFEKEKRNITAADDHVARIDEQNVTFVQSIDDIMHIEFFDPQRKNSVSHKMDINTRLRIDTGDSSG